MARSIGQGRTIEQKQPVPKYKLPPEIVPDEQIFFNPPAGVDVVTPLIKLPREASPVIRNFVLDRGLMRSRLGFEKYHNKRTGERIQLTADISGSASNSVTVTARSTGSQSNNGWIDPDGVNDNTNSVTGGPGSTSVIDGNRLYNKLGDPAIDNNVDAYDDQYSVPFSVTVDHGSVPSGYTTSAEVDIEYSTDNGTNWTNLGGGGSHNALRSTSGTTTNSYTVVINVSGTPTHVWIRLKLKIVVQAPSGTATGTVTVSGPVTWNTSTSTSAVGRLPTRWCSGHLQFYEDPTDAAADWTDRYTFPASQINTDFLRPSYVLWKDTLISTDIGDTPQAGGGTPIGSKGLISSILVSPFTTTILTHSPRAANLFVLGNRVCAVRTNEWTSTTNPWVTGAITNLARIRWSVKNDSNDWDGVGSGWEDLVVSAGSSDEAMAGVAVSDDTAIIVSEKTIRRMDVTGFVDAPFRFGFLDKALGTQCRYTVREVPGGCIFIGYDDAFIVTLSGVERIGSKALRNSLKVISNPRFAFGYTDKYNSRYLVSFKEGSQQVVWQFSFFDKGWTRLDFPFDIAAIDVAFFNVNGVQFFGTYLTQSIFEGLSARENPNRSQDIDTSGNNIDAELEARTGILLSASGPLYKTQVIRTELVYESAGPQDIMFEYSNDGGANWSTYGLVTIGLTTRPSVVKVVKPLTLEALQLRARSTKLGMLKVISFHAFVVPGPRILT